MVTMRTLTADHAVFGVATRAHRATKPVASKPFGAVSVDRWTTITRRPSEASP